MHIKRSITGGLLLMMLFVLFAGNGTKIESGFFTPPQLPVANGDWQWSSTEVTGTVIPQNELPGSAGDEWSLLLSSGIQISSATTICHPFRGGQYGWVSEIRMLSGNTWVSVPTTTGWVPDKEGQLMTCANAPMSGTYAIFGYWIRPEGWAPHYYL